MPFPFKIVFSHSHFKHDTKEILVKFLKEQKLLVVAFLLLVLDQATKLSVKGFNLFGFSHEGMFLHESIPVFGDTLRWTFVENAGMAFGIEFGVYKIVLSLFSIAASVALVWVLWKLRLFNKWVQIGVMFLLAGATGNLIDRVFYGTFYGTGDLFYGKVVDFIDADIPDITFITPPITRFWVFNVADSCVTIGIILLLFVSNYLPTWNQLVGKEPEGDVLSFDAASAEQSNETTESIGKHDTEQDSENKNEEE